MELTFLGGCDIKDNSCLLLESKFLKILLDCGNFHLYEEELIYQEILRNIDYIIVTHSHIDHSNLLPRILMDGFEGKIISTNATRDLLYHDLKRKRNVYFAGNLSKYQHQKLLSSMLHHSKILDYYQPYQLDQDLSIILLPAGHMLGSSQILVNEDDKQLLYSGDINPRGTVLQPPFEGSFMKYQLSQLGVDFSPDFTVIESTRMHTSEDSFSYQELVERFHLNLMEVLDKAGNILITARPKERAQEILYLLRYLAFELKIAPLEIIVIGPIYETSNIYLKYNENLNDKLINPSIYENLLAYPVVDQFSALKNEFGGDSITQKQHYASGGLRVFLIPDTFITDTKTMDLIIALKNDRRNQLLMTSYNPKETNAEILYTAYNQIKKRRGLYLVDNELRILDSSLMERGLYETEKFDFRLTVKKMTEFPSHGGSRELIEYTQELIRNGCTKFALVHGSFQARSKFKHLIGEINDSISTFIPKVKSKFII